MKTTTLILIFTSVFLNAQQQWDNKPLYPIVKYTSTNSLSPQKIKTDTYDYYGNYLGSEIEYGSGYIYRSNSNGDINSAIRQRSSYSIHTYEPDGTVKSEYGSREPNSMSIHSDGSFSIYDDRGNSKRYKDGGLISRTKKKLRY